MSLDQAQPERITSAKAAQASAMVVNSDFADTISVIVRFHDFSRLGFLEEALFSLTVQSWPHLETVLVIQNGNEQFEQRCTELVDQLPWPTSPFYQVISVPIAEGVDGRSTLLNRGIATARGKYLAFLDDDDLVYHHGYETLIKQLKNCGAALAVGGCRMSRMRLISGNWFVMKKENPFAWGRTREDLLTDNFIPIHSYVIDRHRVDSADLYFDDAMPPLEDYDLLLRLVARYRFDFSKLEVPVCEYRVHGGNSIPYDSGAQWFVRSEAHRRAQKLIDERKKNLDCLIPAVDLIHLKSEVAQLRSAHDRLIRESQVNQAELSSKIAETAMLLESVTGSVGWRLINRYGPIKYRVVLPALQTIRNLFRPGVRNGRRPQD